MAHYAQVNENNIVTNVIVVSDEFTEATEWLTETYGPKWIVTSYNTRAGVHYSPITGEPDDGAPVYYNYASIGYIWDPENQAFYDPSPPYKSWTLDKSNYTWVPPVPKPIDWPEAIWNEPTLSWAKVASPFFSWHYNIELEKWEAPTPMPEGTQAIWYETRQSWIVIPPPYPSWKYDPYFNAWIPPVEQPSFVELDWSWDDVKQEWYPANPLVNND